MRVAIALLIIAVLSTLTAGCGVRGPLEPPPGAETVEGPDGTKKGPIKQEDKPHRGFILDSLLD